MPTHLFTSHDHTFPWNLPSISYPYPKNRHQPGPWCCLAMHAWFMICSFSNLSAPRCDDCARVGYIVSCPTVQQLSWCAIVLTVQSLWFMLNVQHKRCMCGIKPEMHLSIFSVQCIHQYWLDVEQCYVNSRPDQAWWVGWQTSSTHSLNNATSEINCILFDIQSSLAA